MKVMRVIFLILLPFAGHSQTSWEEYNYITGGDNPKGGLYRVKAEGADMKIGYNLELAHPEFRLMGDKNEWWSVTLYHFKKGLLKKGLVVETKDSWGNRRYLCIPASGSASDIIKKSQLDIQNVGTVWDEAILLALARFSASLLRN